MTLGLEALGLEAIGLEALGLEAQGRFWMLLADTSCSWLILVNKSRKNVRRYHMLLTLNN